MMSVASVTADAATMSTVVKVNGGGNWIDDIDGTALSLMSGGTQCWAALTAKAKSGR